MTHVLDSAAADARFGFQLRMLERGASELVTQISRIDDLLFKIKATFITVWIATIGWAFTIRNGRLLPLAFVVVVAFWMFEGLFRGIQSRYIDRSRQVMNFTNDPAALQRAFESRSFPPKLVYPLAPDETEWERLLLYIRGLISPFVATLYLFVGLVTYLLYIAAPFEP